MGVASLLNNRPFPSTQNQAKPGSIKAAINNYLMTISSLMLGIPYHLENKPAGLLKLISDHPNSNIEGNGTVVLVGKALKSNYVADLTTS